jgi:ABC-2 type transport system ATP-binding protein
MTAAIETSGLTKTFGPTRAVADLDLRVQTGDIFGFLGPNGAGKTTTARMLLALHRPTSGRATVLGLDCTADSVAIHHRTGYLPGELALCPRMTGQAHIDWFARARGIRDLSLARELADRFGAVLDRPARNCPQETSRRSASSWPSWPARSCSCSTSPPRAWTR